VADPAAAAAAADPGWILAELARSGPSGVLGLIAVVELHRIRAIVDRMTDRIARLEARFYATVTEQRDP
jgi:hypothetical protein